MTLWVLALLCRHLSSYVYCFWNCAHQWYLAYCAIAQLLPSLSMSSSCSSRNID